VFDKAVPTHRRLQCVSRACLSTVCTNLVCLSLTHYVATCNRFCIELCHEPTVTGAVVRYNSCHPAEHKYAAVRYVAGRLNTSERRKEWNIVRNSLQNNSFCVTNGTERSGNNVIRI
jgi:hypothetical protein